MNESNILWRMGHYMHPIRIDKQMVKLWAFWIFFNLILFAIPKIVVEGTVLILVPLAGLFVYALVTKDVMQSLLLGTFSMYILWHKFGAVNGFFADLMTSLSDEENITMYMSFFLCGGVIIAL